MVKKHSTHTCVDIAPNKFQVVHTCVPCSQAEPRISRTTTCSRGWCSPRAREQKEQPAKPRQGRRREMRRPPVCQRSHRVLPRSAALPSWPRTCSATPTSSTSRWCPDRGPRAVVLRSGVRDRAVVLRCTAAPWPRPCTLADEALRVGRPAQDTEGGGPPRSGRGGSFRARPEADPTKADRGEATNLSAHRPANVCTDADTTTA